MYGPHRFPTLVVVAIMCSFLMISHITYGFIQFARRAMFSQNSYISRLMSTTNSNLQSNHSSVKTVVNTTTPSFMIILLVMA